MGPLFPDVRRGSGFGSQGRWLWPLVCWAPLWWPNPVLAAPTLVPRWPQVPPQEQSAYFPDARKAAANFAILDIQGRPAYYLKCHTGDYEGPDDFDYSGDFHCRLISNYAPEGYRNLLSEEPNEPTDWETRARVFAWQLVGECGEIPDYGRVRNFRLRWMRITLEFSDVVLDLDRSPPDSWQRLRAFRFTMRVRPNARAATSIAERVRDLPLALRKKCRN